MREYIRERVMVAPDGCWIWTLGGDKDGYGKAKFGGRDWRAHRLAFVAFRGPIPDGKILDHVVCDQPACANPWHVEPSTVRENTLRSERAPAAKNSRATHCKRGHEFTAENTYLQHKGDRVERICRECERAKSRRQYLARKRRE